MTRGGTAEALAALLTDLKERRGLSYEQLGRKAHLSRSTVHRYCTGRSVPSTFAPVEAIATACQAGREDLARLYRLWERADLARDAAEAAVPAPADPAPEPATPEPKPATPSKPKPRAPSEPKPAAEPEPATPSEPKPRAPSEPKPAAEPEPATPSEPELRARAGALRRRVATVVAVAVGLVVALVSSGTFATTPAPPPAAPVSITVPMWSSAPRALEPEFVGVTANSNTGKMPTFQVGSVRLWNSRTRWQNLEPERGRYDWETLDRLVEGARGAGLPVVMVFGGTPGWASPAGPKSVYTDDSRTSPPDDLADWDRFVGAVAREYRGRIDAYELWDMPNHPATFTGSVPEMVEMTRRASRVIRSTDRDAVVVCPSMGELWNREALDKLRLFAELGGYQHCDAAAVKLSARRDADPPETMLTVAAEIDKVLHRSRVGIDRWSTGSAYDVNTQPRLDEDRAADHAVRYFLSGLYAEYRRMYFYNWGSAKIPIVLQAVDGPETKAARYVERLRGWLAGSRIHSCGQGGSAGLPDGLWQCRFDRAGRTFLIWWTIGSSLRVPAASGTTSVERLDGSVEPAEAGADLEVTGTPFLLRTG